VWVGGNNKSGAGIYLLNVVKNMDLQSYVTFTGNEGADYYDFLCASDAVILTSSRESLSLVTAEAIVAGKPVVAFDCGGVREIIEDGSTGLILQSWNTDDAVSRMVSIMEAPLQPDTVQKEAVESKFDLVKQVEKWDKLIQDHIGSK
jgi:glycosyltransferase involved in cell wall biosynthesis